MPAQKYGLSALFTSILWAIISIFLVVQNSEARLTVKDLHGQTAAIYQKSYALILGVSNYTAGWPDLESIPKEAKQLKRALGKNGFQVQTVLNPNSAQLKEAIESFIHRYGFEEQNRLLIFYSGHGHTRKQGEKGYLVPTDAPNPQNDPKGFLRKAISMSQMLTWARQIEAKHALFLFDSCFSGTIFKTRALPKTPPQIRQITAEPVRQFITAGKAGEEVPARSTFVPVFIDAVLHSKGDLNRDGYVTGTELGLHLQTEVPKYAQQTPQFGKIRDYALSRGDFVFFASNQAQQNNTPLPSSQKQQTTPHETTQHTTVSSQQYALTIEAEPKSSRIRILNIRPRYRSGIRLPPGNYDIEVSAQGYQKKTFTITMQDRDQIIEVALHPKGTPGGGIVQNQTLSNLPEQLPQSPEGWISTIFSWLQTALLWSWNLIVELFNSTDSILAILAGIAAVAGAIWGIAQIFD
ncbi:caspase family protein [Magnetococcales bacterium HHB-1]